MKGKETSTLLHGHDLEPKPDQQLESVLGKSSFPSNDQSTSSDLEIPIALQKGVRACTKHFSNYLDIGVEVTAQTCQRCCK